MRLSELVMKATGGGGEEAGEESGSFGDAAGEFLELLEKGKKKEAIAALKAAIEICVGEYDEE